MAKPRDFKAEYARRIERAKAQGKTRQQARGHKPKEHIERRERERRENGGLTLDQIRRIYRWHEKAWAETARFIFLSLEALIEFAQQNGYDAFTRYRKVWDRARRVYLADGSKDRENGEAYDYLIQLHKEAGVPLAPRPDQYSWLYYH